MLYKLAKSVLFQMQPETAHHLIMENLDWVTSFGLHKLLTHTPPEDPVEVMGIRFPNTIGLAAGMDKDGERVSAFGALGFGHVEIGTITPLAQPGNAKPRCFRVIPAEGIINRMGFNNEGCDKVLKNLKSADAFKLRGGVLGINIGKNAVTPIENAVSDYRICLQKTYAKADYIAVNISSPNTKNLRTLQGDKPLCELLEALKTEREKIMETQGLAYKPIAVKLAPDLDNDAILRAVDHIVSYGMDAVIATNLTSVFTMTRACLRPMIKARYGRIINMSSVVAQMGNAGQANYAAAKAGIIGMSKSVAQEVASRGITVNCITPGFVETDMTKALPEETRKALSDRIPAKRLGQTDDIAGAVLFLASDLAGYVTGAVLPVNGGLFMG